MDELRTTVVMDYQNVHLVGHYLFPASRYRAPHESLVDPLHFSNQLVQARNHAQRLGLPHARLERVLAHGCRPPAPLVRERNAMAGLLLGIRRAVLSGQADTLIDAPPAPLCPRQGSEHQPGASWETWDD